MFNNVDTNQCGVRQLTSVEVFKNGNPGKFYIKYAYDINGGRN